MYKFKGRAHVVLSCKGKIIEVFIEADPTQAKLQTWFKMKIPPDAEIESLKRLCGIFCILKSFLTNPFMASSVWMWGKNWIYESAACCQDKWRNVWNELLKVNSQQTFNMQQLQSEIFRNCTIWQKTQP